MKRFAHFFISCLVIFLALWGVAEWGVKKVDTEYTHKYRHVYNNPAISTLLMGASLFENGINPQLLQDNDSIYDFATSGRWIYWDVQLAKKIFPTMPNLKTVLFPIAYDVMYASLHFRPCRQEDETNIYEYQKYMEVYYDRVPQKYTCRSGLYMNQMGFKIWRRHWFNSFGQYALPMRNQQWETTPDPCVFDNDIAQKCYREYTDYLIQFAQICNQNNIRFIAVTPPCADYYVNYITKEGVDNLYALVDSVRAYYPIEYLNYLDDEEFRSDSIYYNANHLNSIGADMFSKRVRYDFNL